MRGEPTTIPRLELQAALLGARLAKSLADELEIPILKRNFWSDSIMVLRWICTEPCTKQTFVANRLGELNELSKTSEWRWVPSSLNPADDATRWTDSPHGSEERWIFGRNFIERARSIGQS